MSSRVGMGVSIQEKLKQAKEKLEEFYIQYPHLNPDNSFRIDEIKKLEQTFNEIILTQSSL